jgi:hypothetical protein
MSNSESLPSKTGLREAQELLKRLREKKPSDELVKIIDEVTEEKNSDDKSYDRAAKKHDPELGR